MGLLYSFPSSQQIQRIPLACSVACPHLHGSSAVARWALWVFMIHNQEKGASREDRLRLGEQFYQRRSVTDFGRG